MTEKEKYKEKYKDPEFRRRVLETNRRWRHKNRARLKEYHAAARRRFPERTLWYCAKTRARSRNLDFNIEVSDIVIPNFCSVLGIPIHRSEGKVSDNSPSLDRIRPELGYVKGNICVISFRANTIKQNASSTELRRVADWVDNEHSRRMV